MILSTWCLELVLAALNQAPFEPIETCRLKYLTCKTVFLLLITSGRRAVARFMLQGTIHIVFQYWSHSLYEHRVPSEGLYQGQCVAAHLCASSAQSHRWCPMQTLCLQGSQ